MEPKLVKPTIKDVTLSRLDESIQSILQSDLPEDVKAKHYASMLRMHKVYEEEKVLNPIIKMEKMEADVLKSIPLSNQYKANRILSLLKRDSDVSFNEAGELIYKRNVIKGSNITDLVSDLSQRSSAIPPSGTKEIAASLRYLNAPKELINNQNVLKLMYPTPQRISSPAPSRKSRRKKKTNIRWEEY